MKPSNDFLGDNPKEGTINPIIGLANALNKEANHNQQPEVLTCQGGGESTGVGVSSVSGYSESGKSEEYPSADTLSNHKTKIDVCHGSKYWYPENKLQKAIQELKKLVSPFSCNMIDKVFGKELVEAGE